MKIKSILIILGVCIVVFCFVNISFATDTAKVKVETANLRGKADDTSTILDQISINQEVEILEKTGSWYKVKVKGITGYLREDLIIVNQTNNNTSNVTNTTNAENNLNVVNNTNTYITNTVENVTTSTEQQETTTEGINTEQNKNEETSGVVQPVQEISLGDKKISEDTILKIVPTINSINMGEVKKDEVVNVVEVLNGWISVETSNSKGWIRVDKVQKEETVSTSTETVETKEESTVQSEKVEDQITSTNTVKTMYVNSTSVNVRKEANTSAEIVTTAVLNTSIEVISEESNWSKVKVNGKEGYISSSLLSSTKKETSRSAETTRRTQEDETSNEVASTDTSSAEGSNVVATAQGYIGSSYIYGGTTPSGFDCSGFTQYVYSEYGISLNRTAAAQYKNGVSVDKGELQLGDLVMFGKSGINHVGIYIGGGRMVHAANSSRGVTTDTINSGYYYTNYVGAKRVL